MKDEIERLQDILSAIELIEKYRDRQAFEDNELIQSWMIHHLQIIGEASRYISNGLRQQSPEIPWSEIIAMRNILVHDYSGIDLEEVWSTVERDVPILKNKITKFLERLGVDFGS